MAQPRFRSGLTPRLRFFPSLQPCLDILDLAMGHEYQQEVVSVQQDISSTVLGLHSGEERRPQPALPLSCRRCPSEQTITMVTLIIWDEGNFEGFIHSEWFSDLIFFHLHSTVATPVFATKRKYLLSAPLASPPHPPTWPILWDSPLLGPSPEPVSHLSLPGNSEHILGQRVM